MSAPMSVPMIEPELAGAALADDIRAARPRVGEAFIWRLGQSGIVMKFAGGTVLIDAYLSNHCEAVLGEPFDHRRLTRSPLDPVDLDVVDLVICSHDHLDHLDPPTLRTFARQNPGAKVAVPRAAVSTLEQLGWSPARVIACDDGTAVDLVGLRIASFAVPHDDFDEDPDGHPYLGWTIESGGVRIGHLGDARSHPRVIAALAEASVDLLAVPINGRSAQRAAMGFAGNMNAAEAVDLGLASGAGLVLPMHYDMFAQNIDPDALAVFVEAAQTAGLPTVVLPVGRRHVVAPPRAATD